MSSSVLEAKQKEALAALTQGKAENGLALLRECLELSESLNGPNSLDTAQAAFTLALCVAKDSSADAGEVESLAKRALQIRQSVFGPVHASVALTAEFLGNFYVANNKPVEAEEMFRLALSNAEQLVGAHHVNTAKLQLRLADLLVRAEKAGEAVELAEKAFETRKRFFPSDSQELHSAAYALAQALVADNQPGRASAVIRSLAQDDQVAAQVLAPGQQAMR